MVTCPFEPPPFYVDFAEGDVSEGRKGVGALVPVMILPAKETVIEDSIVHLSNP